MTEYKVRIRGVEVVVDSIDALDELIDRYGAEAGETNTAATSHASSRPTSVGGSMEKVLLRKFVEAGRRGIPTVQLNVSLAANRKQIRSKLQGWAEKIGLGHGAFEAVFERNIHDGKRGYRLTDEALQAGKDILGLN